MHKPDPTGGKRKKSTGLLNNWRGEKVLHRDNIIEFDLLLENEFIIEIQDDYYCLNKPADEVELYIYEKKTRELMEKHGIVDLEKELKSLIKKYHEYNELREIAQTLAGRIAEARGITVKSVYEELGIPEGD